MRLTRTIRLGVLAGASALGLAASASAQVLSSPDEIALPRTGLFGRDQNISVLDRPRPDYAPLGINLDSFRIQPELDTSLEYNSNIYAVPTGAVSDEIWHISPAFTATSDWSRNQLQVFGRGSFNEYFDHTGEDTANGAVGLNGRLDVSHDLGIAAGASYEHDSESRTSPNSPSISAHPIEYDLGSAFLVGAMQLTRVRLSARFDFQSYSYENAVTTKGAPLYQKDLDYNVSIGTFRAEYAALPGTSVFANLVINQQENTDLLPTDISRTNSGYEITVGSNFDVTHLIKGEVFLGYLDQTFQNSYYKEVSGVSLRGYVQWFPTQLVTLTFSGTRVPVDSAIPGVGAYLDSNLSGRFDYELLRNFLISGSATFEYDDYSGISRHDNRNFETLSATYLMNRRIGLSLIYQHQQNASAGALAGLDFDINSLTAGINLRY
jgi:hypothetical protein